MDSIVIKLLSLKPVYKLRHRLNLIMASEGRTLIQ